MAAPRIRFKRSSVPGKKPTYLELGRFGVNTYDAEVYLTRERAGIGTDIVSVSTGARVKNVLHVTNDGKDTNTGRKEGDAFATIKKAVSVATPGTVIRIAGGIYNEDNPITVPDQVGFSCDILRDVEIYPNNPNEDLFYWGSGNMFENASFRGTMPGKAIFSFDPAEQRYINQSPYVRNCTNFIPGSLGMRIDGDIVIGPLKSMVVDSYTQYNQGGIGVSITNSAYAQLVSIFTICDNIAIYCGSGGACDLTNSNSSFGTYGMIADGVSPMKYVGVITANAGFDRDTFDIDLTTPTFNVVNALYDNRTGVTTIYTNQPHKFNVGMSVTIAGLGFTCGTTVGVLTYPSGSKGNIFEVKTVAPGRFLDASNLIISNKQEIVDKSLASIALNYPDFVYPGDNANDPSYRFKDSYRLIQQNKQEIIDKSLASIAVGFPTGFRFPTDPVPYRQNRYYDASRLIQLNKQEIIDKSIAAVAIAHSDFYFPGDAQPNSRNRYYDSYRLIQKNRDVIVNISWTNTLASYPGISTTQSKCKRDIGFFVDAISADVFTGGNNYSRQFVLQYFNATGNPISNGLVGEETQSIFAFEQARNLMKSAITNTLVGAAYSDLTLTVDPITLSNTNPNSCSNVRTNIDNLTSIVTTTIIAGNTLSLPPANVGGFSTGGTKCARDIGYLVDALATDIFTGGNAYAKGFALQYFDNSGNPIVNGVLGETNESITAFNAAREYAKKAVTNQLNFKNLSVSSGLSTYQGTGSSIPVDQSGNENSCADVQSNINTLINIITTTIGAGNTSSLPPTNLGISTTNKCARDIGYFVDAISTDLFTGGNSYVISFIKQYFDSVGSASSSLLGEETQSVYSFNSVGNYAKAAITNQLNKKDRTLTADPSPESGAQSNTNPTSCSDVQSAINTLVSIATLSIESENLTALNNITINNGSFITGESKCRRDISYIVDAIASDLKNYTNSEIIKATKLYFNSNGSLITNGLYGETNESITAFNAVRSYCKLAINNLLNNRNNSLAIDPATGSNVSPYSCANVQTTIDNLVDILITNLSNGNLNSLPNISLPSTTFTVNVGISTLQHFYNSGGTVKCSTIRPFDGEVVYFGDLYNEIDTMSVGYGGTGYTFAPNITIEDPDTSWGVAAQAVANIENGSITTIEIVSTGRGYTRIPKITVEGPSIGFSTAKINAEIKPTYYSVSKAIPIGNDKFRMTINETVPYNVGMGTIVPFYKQSRILASGHSFQYIGAGDYIDTALPWLGGVPIQENETVSKNGGLVVYTSTDQSGNFRIGSGVIVNQNTGTVSGSSYTKSLFSTLTPFILALGGD
jgi:hypothetical protein